MLEFLQAPDHVAAFRIEGKLNGEDLDRIIADIEARLSRHRRIGVMADMTGFSDFTLEAAGKDLRYGLSKLGQLSRFPREAVVTDKAWMRALATAAGPLVPGVEVRVFAPGEQQAAIAWAAEVSG